MLQAADTAWTEAVMEVKRVEHSEHSGGVMRTALGQVCESEASGEVIVILAFFFFPLSDLTWCCLC